MSRSKWFLVFLLLFCQACRFPGGDSRSASGKDTAGDFIVQGNGDAFDGKPTQTVEFCWEGAPGTRDQDVHPFPADGFFRFLDECDPQPVKEKKAATVAPAQIQPQIQPPIRPPRLEQVAGVVLTEEGKSEPSRTVLSTTSLGRLEGQPIEDLLGEKWAGSPFLAPERPAGQAIEKKLAKWIEKAGFDAKETCLEDPERLRPEDLNVKCNIWRVQRAIAICRSPAIRLPGNPLARECGDFLKDVAEYQELSRRERYEAGLLDLLGVTEKRDLALSDGI